MKMISKAAALLVVLGLTWKLCLACNDNGLPVTGEHMARLPYSGQHERLKARQRSSPLSQQTHQGTPLSLTLGLCDAKSAQLLSLHQTMMPVTSQPRSGA